MDHFNKKVTSWLHLPISKVKHSCRIVFDMIYSGGMLMREVNASEELLLLLLL